MFLFYITFKHYLLANNNFLSKLIDFSSILVFDNRKEDYFVNIS